MTILIAPDVELLVSKFLRSDTDVVALLADRVYTTIPGGDTLPTRPYALVHRFGGGSDVDDLGLLDTPIIQIDVWGDLQRQAARTILTIRAALKQRLAGVYTEGTVKRVQLGPLSYFPDQLDLSANGRPRPRYLTTVTITTRPNRGG